MKFEDLEIWDTVKGFENYKVSSKGRVYSKINDIILSPANDKDGYKLVSMGKKTKKVHRLVGETFYFVDDDEGKQQIDHIDHQPGNNFLLNLRFCSHTNNGYNRGNFKNNTSGYKGVNFIKQTKKWRARIMINGKRRQLGSFKTPQEAYEAYKDECKRQHGEFYFDDE